MDRFAILIDAGYFFAAGAQAALTAAGALRLPLSLTDA